MKGTASSEYQEMRLDIAPLDEWGFFSLPRPCVIAGPCSAESPQQLLETAAALHECGINVFRAGIWKPRTHPGCFEGHGVPALEWMQEVKRLYGMKISCEVASARHVEECLSHGIDMVWIGARSTANPFLVQEIAGALSGTDIPVMVKNPVNPDVELWIGAVERLCGCGLRKIAAVHRGVSSSARLRYRNEPAWEMAVGLRRRIPGLAIFVDPSHMGGDAAYVRELSQRAMDLGFEGLMIESHSCPCKALSDAGQQLSPQQLRDLLAGPDRLAVRERDTDNAEYRENMSQLRAEIDVIDDNIISLLERRMDLSAQIGAFKKENNISILQTGRWESVLGRMAQKGVEAGMDEEFVRRLFNLIHDASVGVQNKVLERKQ